VNGEEIVATPSHPFWVEYRGWVEAADIRAGEELRLEEDGMTAAVEWIEYETLPAPVPVYNLEVADWHTYYVSGESVLVHNRCDMNFPFPFENIRNAKMLVSWLKGIQNNRILLTLEQVQEVLETAKKYGVKVSADAHDLSNFHWDLPHFHVGDARIHVPVTKEAKNWLKRYFGLE
jgi:hypothetical protein